MTQGPRIVSSRGSERDRGKLFSGMRTNRAPPDKAEGPPRTRRGPSPCPAFDQSWTRIRYFDADQNSSGWAISTLPVTLPSLATVEVR